MNTLLKSSKLEMAVVTDPVELAKSQTLREQFERNWRWYQAHLTEIGEKHRGKAICIAGEQLFSADSPEEVIALAKAAHPEDAGLFSHYIPLRRLARIYAHSWQMGG